MTPRISLIIPVKNGRATLPAALQAVCAQANLTLGEDYEIIVVDDGSDDGTAGLVPRQHGLRVITQPNAGPASARNTGARAAVGQILVFTDADCVPAENWLDEMTRPFRDESTCGVKGAYRTRERGWVPRFVQAEFEERYRYLARFEQIDFVDTYSAAYRAEAFLDAEGFDVTYPVPSVEDQELSFRLASAGARLVFQPTALVFHRHDLNVPEYARRKFGIGYWKAILLRRMPERAFQDTYTPSSLRIQVGLSGLLLADLAGLLAASILSSPAVLPLLVLAAVLLAGFVLSARPFFRLAVELDPALAVWILPMLLVRALSLGSGLGIGMAASYLRPLPPGRRGTSQGAESGISK